jgi:hypothetical protein
MERSRTLLGISWKYVLVILGGLVLLAAVMALSMKSLGEGCGTQVLHRWSLPYFAVVITVGLVLNHREYEGQIG